MLVTLLPAVVPAAPTSAAEEAEQVPRPEIVDLGALPGGSTSTAHAINDHGHVVGESTTDGPSTHAFLWRHGRMIDLGTLTGPQGTSRAVDINNRGQIVGTTTAQSDLGFPAPHAFLWEDGHMKDLGTLPGGFYSFATGINDRGEVVGRAHASGGEHAFLWRRGRMIDLGLLPGDNLSSADAINDHSQVAGASAGSTTANAVIWEDGAISGLALPPGASGSGALDINDRGDVVGIGTFPGTDAHDRAVVWRDGVPRVLDVPNPFSRAEGINDDGQIVGSSGPTAFLWERGVVIRLPNLVETGVSAAFDINEHGVAVGHSSTGDFASFDHAVLWR